MTNIIDILITAKDQASATIKKLEGTINGAQTSVGSFFEKNQQGLRSIQIASGVALAGVTALGVGAIAQASKMQDLRQQFDTLTWSAEKGKALFMDIQKFAAQTPFDSAQLAAATSTMLGFGVSQEKVMGSMKMLGDIALGNGDRLQSLALAFGQVQAKWHLAGQEVLQMINAGFNPLEAISKKTGKSMDELSASMAKGGISVQMVEEAMKDATSEGGRFHNGMEQASKTFSGVMSTMRDNIGITLAAIAGFANGEIVEGGLIDILTRAMAKMMPLLESFSNWAAQNGTLLTAILGITWGLAALTTVATTIGFLIPSITLGFGALGSVLAVLTGPVGLVIAGIALLGTAWATNFLGIRDITASVWEWVKATFSAGIAWIMETVGPFLEQVRKFWDENGQQILAGLNMFWQWVKIVFTELFEWIKLYVGTSWEVISAIFTVTFDIIKWIFQVFFTTISGILTVGMAILNWDWESAWNAIKETFSRIGAIIVQTGGAVFEKLHSTITSIVGRTETYIAAALTRIKDTLREIVTLGMASTATYNPTQEIAGTRANGGPVTAGKLYEINERGQELFMPSVNGSMIPSDKIGSSVNIQVNIPGNISIRSDQDITKLAREVSQELAREMQTYKLWVS